MIEPAELAKSLAIGFDLDELGTLAFQVGVQLDDLKGGPLKTKAQELVQYCDRRGLLDALIAAAMTARPNLYWNEVAESVPSETLRFMLPTIASGTKQLMSIKFARFEGRQNALGVCLRQTKAVVGACLALGFVNTALIILLIARGLS